MSLFPIKTQTLTYFIIILNIFPSVSKQAGVEPKSISMENKAAERDSNNQTYSSAVFCETYILCFSTEKSSDFHFSTEI